MKRLSTLVAVLMLSLQAFAQLPDGSIAPNWTSTDINGNTHTLYDYLDQGKPVIMDISATWCGPCWSYHNTHAMKDLYEAHGPNGDNKVMVFYVEGDDATNTNCIYGSAGCNNSTQGNWTTGTPYPIIDDHTIFNAYEATYFPTIFLICPDRTLIEIGQVNAAKLWEGAQNCAVQFGQNNAGIYQMDAGTPFKEICGATPAAPEFRLTNLGTSPLTSAKVDLKWNGNTVQTINWSGNLATYAADQVVFDQFTIDQAGSMAVEVSNVNGGVDEDVANNAKSVDFSTAPSFSTQKVYLKIKTDNYGAETYWEMHDDQGNVLDKGGNEAIGLAGAGTFSTPPSHPSAYGNGQTIRDTLTLPANGCYSIHFVDAYGDGMCCGAGQGYFRLYNLGNTVTPIVQGGEFEAYDARPFGGSGFTGIEELIPANEFDVYPNPASDVLNVEFVLNKKSNVSIFVTNSLGQTVRDIAGQTLVDGFHNETINVRGLAAGLYFVNLRTAEGIVTRKFTVSK